jgi:hypothetical protein
MLRLVECRNKNNSGWIEPVARDWTHRFEPYVIADRRAPWVLGREMSGSSSRGPGGRRPGISRLTVTSGAACLIAFSSRAVSVVTASSPRHSSTTGAIFRERRCHGLAGGFCGAVGS